MTKKKIYEKPSMQVIELQHRTMLLAGSDGQAGVQNYDWTTIPEE